jgi:hypothetical protein
LFIEELKQGENVKNFLHVIGLTTQYTQQLAKAGFLPTAYYLINLEQLSQTFGKMFEFYKKKLRISSSEKFHMKSSSRT